MLTYLAGQYARLYSKDLFIAVTGSYGKSVCKQAAGAVLSQKFKVLTISSLRDLLRLNPQIKKVIIDFYSAVVQPQVVVVVKGNLQEALQEAHLIEQLTEKGVAVLNWDDPNSKKLADKCKGNRIYFGTDPQNCTVWAGNIRVEDFRTTFELNLGVERVKVNLKLLGQHQIYPLLAAAALGALYNLPLTKIKLALESIQPQEHSLQAVLGPNGSIILDDTLSGSPEDLEAAIDTLIKIPARRRVLVLGEMKGLGKYSESQHKQAAQMIYKEKIDQVYLGGGDAQIVADELKSLGFWEEKLSANLQNSQLVAKLLKTLGKGDVCLIKGSKEVRLDEVVKRITKK